MPRVRFLPTFLLPEPVDVDVPPGTSLQEAAYAAHAPIGDACGGNCACSTCHVHVVEGFESLAEMDDAEDDILGKATDVQAISRLGCQALVGRADLVIRITPEGQLAFINEHPEHRGREGEIKG